MNRKTIDVKDKVGFGNLIREEREKQKLTQLQVAKIAKMNANYYAMVERGDPRSNVTLELMTRILEALKMKVTISGI